MEMLATALLLITLTAQAACSLEVWVSPEGSDAGTGTQERPLKSLAAAQMVVRKSGDLGQKPVTVHVLAGTYELSQPLVFTPEDSGSKEAPVLWTTDESHPAVISGGYQLNLTWQEYKDGIFKAETPKDLKTDQLFVNGELQLMARYPNYDPNVLVYNGYSPDAFSPERAARWAHPEGGYIHAMHQARWGGFHYLITGKDENNQVKYEGGWQNNRPAQMHSKYRLVENIFEELDAPREWYHDQKQGILYYQPPEGLDLTNSRIEAVRLAHLVEFRGRSDQPVKHIELCGFTFQRTARTFMDTKEPLLRSDWTIYRGGAVVFEGAEDCALKNAFLDHVGGNAVFASNYNRRVLITGCHIQGAGASGVCLVGDPKSVRNPLFNYNQRQSYSEIDKTPGPKGVDFPEDCTVTDSLIHSIGLVEKQAAGVEISMSRRITVSHCSIYDVGRAGINISEGTFGGHLIDFCDVFDTVLETGDHGSFNSWGRDRYWKLKDPPPDPTEYRKLAALDTETTTLRNSRWRCDHGWDIDLDDGSSHYEIYNNLLLAGGLKLREGFHRRATNNITVNNSFHPHVWYPESGDVVTGNIWGGAYRPIGMGEGWGDEVDRNLFPSEQILKSSRESSLKVSKKKAPQGKAVAIDVNSVAGDPAFINPEKGDYRVSDTSPALKIGFKNFPMDQFGVKRPALKAIARTPKLPTDEEPAKPSAPKADASLIHWMGASMRQLQGREFSAFGVSEDAGGLRVLSVKPESEMAKIGLKEGDVVSAINGVPMVTSKDLDRVLKQPLATVTVVREQVSVELKTR